MTNEEANKVLEELHEVRPEKLNDKAKRLFEAIMKIADCRDKAEADLYEANNRRVDLMNIIDERDKIIELMAKTIDNYDSQLEINYFKDVEHIKQYFKEYAVEERCHNG